MLKEALEYLSGLATKAAAPQEIETDDPRFARYLTGSGSVIKVELDPLPRDHRIGQLSDLISLARESAAAVDTCVVWYDENAVVLIMDDGEHRCQKAAMILAESDVFSIVRKLGVANYDHKSFIRLLRVHLAGALNPGSLLEIVRRIRFENGSVTNASVQKNRESLGREITSAVSAESEIPDVVTLAVPVYKTLGEADPYPVRCTVEVDPIEGRFRLTPFPDEIERVQQLAVGSIAERLAEALPESVPAYYGRP